MWHIGGFIIVVILIIYYVTRPTVNENTSQISEQTAQNTSIQNTSIQNTSIQNTSSTTMTTDQLSFSDQLPIIADQPITQSVTQPATAQPIIVEQPATQPVAQTVAQPIAQPVVEQNPFVLIEKSVLSNSAIELPIKKFAISSACIAIIDAKNYIYWTKDINSTWQKLILSPKLASFDIHYLSVSVNDNGSIACIPAEMYNVWFTSDIMNPAWENHPQAGMTVDINNLGNLCVIKPGLNGTKPYPMYADNIKSTFRCLLEGLECGLKGILSSSSPTIAVLNDLESAFILLSDGSLYYKSTRNIEEPAVLIQSMGFVEIWTDNNKLFGKTADGSIMYTIDYLNPSWVLFINKLG